MSVVVGIPSIVSTAAFVASGVVDESVDGLIAGQCGIACGVGGCGARDAACSGGSGWVGCFGVECGNVAGDASTGGRRIKAGVEGVACVGKAFGVDGGWGRLGRGGLCGLDGGVVVGGAGRGDLGWGDGWAFVFGFHARDSLQDGGPSGSFGMERVGLGRCRRTGTKASFLLG